MQELLLVMETRALHFGSVMEIWHFSGTRPEAANAITEGTKEMINIYQHDQHQHPKPQGDQPLIDILSCFLWSIDSYQCYQQGDFRLDLAGSNVAWPMNSSPDVFEGIKIDAWLYNFP